MHLFCVNLHSSKQHICSVVEYTICWSERAICWSNTIRGAQAVWNAYVASMRQAGFKPDVPMYVASGLLTYGASDGEDVASSFELLLACWPG